MQNLFRREARRRAKSPQEEPPPKYSEEIGETRDFILAKGFVEVGPHVGLIGEDDRKRLFAELYADPDRPDVRPAEAYQMLLTSMQPGWTLRVLQMFWPDPLPRQAFHDRASTWLTVRAASTGGTPVRDGSAGAAAWDASRSEERRPEPPGRVHRDPVEGLAILHEGLLLALNETALPFGRRTILEFVYAGEEGLTWWEGIGNLCQAYGVRVTYLGREEIQALTHWIMNPRLE